MISVSTVGINTNYPNLYMYDQCKYSKCVGVNTNHPNLYMYDQCTVVKISPNLYKYDHCKYSGCKHQPPKPLCI